MFIAVLSMFLMDTAMFFIDINNAVKEVSYTLTSNSNLSLQDRLFLTYSLRVPYPAQSAMYAFMLNLGDVIVVWRVFAFYSPSTRGGRWLLAFPVMLLATSFATSGLISFCIARFNNEEGAAGELIHPAFCRNIQLTSYCTTLATTGVATLMISYKTWVYRRTIGRYLDESRRLAAECSNTTPSRVERVAAILIESGILYFLFYVRSRRSLFMAAAVDRQRCSSKQSSQTPEISLHWSIQRPA
ncbi:hypothetical protein PHLGIDRAFT_309370 [Phlebiopsis gigantea 11061_1 CR5-6]|uniref:G-protein coupled receptors family 1 profile domain-containing protein n=1 Tax=Phlebiopsis gigantea (strain 11061_1 CR5-6) TaxID=745531 RepID=A0A0C3PB39_PHLG1|nr:hypothetical protein PHLGIDRAFT_309370 [Phlebiopsis gigantea 11061_1 CR5-6]